MYFVVEGTIATDLIHGVFKGYWGAASPNTNVRISLPFPLLSQPHSPAAVGSYSPFQHLKPTSFGTYAFSRRAYTINKTSLSRRPKTFGGVRTYRGRVAHNHHIRATYGRRANVLDEK